MKRQILKNVGVIFCGGCNCYFDRAQVYDTLQQNGEGRYHITLWREELDVQNSYDLVVIINGCSSECLVHEKYQSPFLTINNFNFENAAALVEEALEHFLS